MESPRGRRKPASMSPGIVVGWSLLVPSGPKLPKEEQQPLEPSREQLASLPYLLSRYLVIALRGYVGIRSTHFARNSGAGNGSAKYCVSRATLTPLNSMMLTVQDGLPSYVRMSSVTQRSPPPIIRRTVNRFLLG